MSRSSRGQVWWRVIRTRSLLLGDSPNRGGFGLTLQSVKMHVDFSLYIDRDDTISFDFDYVAVTRRWRWRNMCADDRSNVAAASW